MDITPEHVEDAKRYAGRGLSLAHLITGLGSEIVQVVARMHGSISRSPLPLGTLESDKPRGLSGLIYQIIYGSFHSLDNGFAEAGRILAPPQADDEHSWVKFLAAVNGVCGDKLAAENSPLKLSMQWIGKQTEAKQQIVFIHGLCMSEHGWQGEEQQAFCAWAEQQGHAVSYLRYNSGLHISENGRRLSELLEEQANPEQGLTLIGHSMGGLLIRAALAQAESHNHQWPKRLQAAALLGSPHHGAPLERLGNRANALLKISPYLKPFARLSDLRSAGIRDLRFGNVRDEDWMLEGNRDHTEDGRSLLALPDGPRWLMLAAQVQAESDKGHDYLVPVYSALGLHDDADKRLDNAKLQREVLSETNHMDLLSDAKVYQILKQFLTA